MNRLRILLILLVLVMLLPCAALAASNKPLFSLSCGTASVSPHYFTSYGWCLFLPGSWAGKTLDVHPVREGGVYLNGVLYTERMTVACDDLPAKFSAAASPKGKKHTTAVYRGSSLPALFLTVEQDQLDQINKSKTCKAPAYLTAYGANGEIEFDGELRYLKTRGNSTFQYRKKPYQLHLGKKASLAGLPMAKKFILLADYLDISLLRNRITLNLARAAGLPFSLECMHVDVYLNGEYRGLYLMTEKIQVGSSGVDIADLEEENEEVNPQPLDSYPVFESQPEGLIDARGYDLENDPEDVTGGYLLETDKVYRYRRSDEPGFITSRNMAVYIKQPEHPSRAQVEYIGNLMSAFHRAILSADGTDPATGRHYSQMIDMESFARKYLIEEISKNFDGQRGSQFFYKDRGEDALVYAGPCWDYDLTYGDILQEGFKGALHPRDFYMSRFKSNECWWNNLMKQPDFAARVQQEYMQTFLPLLKVLLGQAEPAYGLQSIDEYKAQIADSAAMNFKRWSPSSNKGYYKEAGYTFDQGVKYLKNWLDKRVQFLTSQWDKQ